MFTRNGKMSTSVNSVSDETAPNSIKAAGGDAASEDGVGVNPPHHHVESNNDGNQASFPPGEAVAPGTQGSLADLETMPLELLMHICSFLDAKYIQTSLSRVSQPFADILSVDSYWRARITNRWPHVYPAVPVDHFDWKKACVEREEMHKKWSKPEDHYDHFSFTAGIFAPVDSVHILQDKRVLASGSRDRYLNIVDVDKLEVANPTSMKTANLHSAVAHKGWIWSLTSLDNQLCSGSWDTYIKLWDLEAGCSQISQFKCKSAVLNLHMEPGQIIAGGYDKRLYQLDPRDGKISERRSHRQAVLCLAVDDDFILTGSEDKTICVFDRKANTVLNTIPFDSYPMCMSYGDNQLWVGDKQGLLHLFDTRHGQFQLVKTYDVGHAGKVTAVQHTLGAIFTCSTDKTLKVLHPNQDPGAITTLHEDGELAGVHFRNGVLVCAGSGVSVEIWRPKVTDSDQSDDQSAAIQIPADQGSNRQDIPQSNIENGTAHPS